MDTKRGEITADKRPENSLLEEHLKYDHLSKKAPIITEESILKIEDLIKQRIKDLIWDDVERKVKPIKQPHEYRRRIELESEKSKLSLAAVYEKEYKGKISKSTTEEESGERTTIKNKMKSLFLQIDALSNFHFTPRPPEAELKVINNLPAITVEQVIPEAVAEGNLLAAQEIVPGEISPLKGKTERSKSDKRRELRKKKRSQKIKAKDVKMRNDSRKVIMSNKYNKEKEQDMKSSSSTVDLSKNNLLTSSKSFFSALQNQIESVKNKSTKLEKKKANISSRNLKL